jgi:NACHT domain
MKPDDLIKLVPALKNIIVNVFFRRQEPSWLSPTIDLVLVCVLVLLGIWGVLLVLSKIKKIWIEDFLSLFYNKAEKIRTLQRQRFAQHIEHEIRQLNNREEWKNYRFTELEAEVEAEGKRKKFSILPFFQPIKRGLRREKSLSKALEFSSERLILVEGEPGSGKSVALRHIAEKMAHSAGKSKSKNSIIPLYINLKKLEIKPGNNIDRNLIESFVKQELNRVNDSDIEKFLEREFQVGIEEKTWLFLFDSFDEIPQILSSIEADETIKNYAEAINNFLSGFNQCRGIIASRQFRGPKHLNWPHFRILPLENRRLQLIRKAELPPKIEKKVLKQVQIASQEIQEMTKNPMFLGILCEDMRAGNPFPENAHSVFERYLDNRLNHDQERLKKRFNLKSSEIRAIAEKVAFSMSMDQNLGLSPTREAIQSAMNRLGLRVPGNFDQLLNALEYLKLARSETEAVADNLRSFTFSHRRFQEYFATCVILSKSGLIIPRELLTDGRWRETAVVIFQTQSPPVFSSILEEVRQILIEMSSSVSQLTDDPIGYVNQETINKNLLLPKSFHWPHGLIHLLALLQDGFISRIKDLPDDIKMQAGNLLLSASVTGTLADKKWSLEVAGIAPQPVLLYLLRNAFANQSQWLKEVAYRQVARLDKIPNDIANSIRQSLLSLFFCGRLSREYLTIEAHLSRIDQSANFLRIMNLLRWIKPIDYILHIIVFFVLTYYLLRIENIKLLVGIVYLILISSLSLRDSSYILENFSSPILLRNPSTVFSWDSYLNFSRFATTLCIRLIFFPLLWAIFAIHAASTGDFIHPFWSLLLLIYPLLKLVKYFPHILEYVRLNLKKILYVLLYACGLIVIIIGLYYLDRFPIISLIIFVILVINSIAVIAIGIAIILRFLQTYFLWIQDCNNWRKSTKKRPSSSMTAQELLNSINLYHDVKFCKKLINLTREQNSLIPIEETDVLMQKLAFVLERVLLLEQTKKRNGLLDNLMLEIKSLSKKRKKNINDQIIISPSESIFFNNWLKVYTREDKNRLIKLGNECLDDIYILSEQIRTRKRSVDDGVK